MKLVMTLLAGSLVGLGLLAGCAETPQTRAELTPPAITVTANHGTIVPGESVLVAAKTQNVVGAAPLKWEVFGPDEAKGAKISPEQRTSNQTAIFTSDKPGTYTVRATADLGNGRTVSNSTQIIVRGSTALD